jgi:hypothetical protein
LRSLSRSAWNSLRMCSQKESPCSTTSLSDTFSTSLPEGRA